MTGHADTINKILWNWGDIQVEELADICKDLPIKIVRWLVAHHPDNRARKHLLRLSNVFCGQGSVINSGFVVSDDFKPLLTIGDRVAISPNVTVICVSAPNNSHLAKFPIVKDRYITSSPVVIGDDSWIGTGAILLPGVAIGKGAIIGAGAVVTENIPGGGVAAGVPAKVIRDLRDNSTQLPGLFFSGAPDDRA